MLRDRLAVFASTFPGIYRYAVRQHPECVDIELTERCNLRCPMCWIHGKHGKGDKYAGQEMNTDEIFDLIGQLSAFGSEIYIGGCEPFVRQDLMPILKCVKDSGLRVYFTTNGTLLDSSNAAMLVEIGVDGINFSIDGNEELHARIRGRGVFGKVVSAIRELRSYRDKAHADKPVIGINVTISRGILGRIGQTIRSLAEITCGSADYYRLHHLWYITPAELAAHQRMVRQVLGCNASGAASHLCPDSNPIDPKAIADEVSSLANIPKLVTFPQMSRGEILQYYSEEIWSNKPCFAPLHAAVVKPNGDVRFCRDEWIDDYTIGNVRETPFDAIWNGRRARTFRLKLLRQKSFPGCKRCSAMF